ncbi:hypothetical protein FZX15_12175 [Brucella suis bv. 1]|nr:hypothetical protein FZX15_12175 [Brucella suis bv. 1]
MPELSSSLSNSSTEHKTSEQIPPEQPSPIRAHYKTEEELSVLAAAVARGRYSAAGLSGVSFRSAPF